jgi:hypothetical protein
MATVVPNLPGVGSCNPVCCRYHPCCSERMTADTALRLERYLGMPAQFWMAVQADYDIRHAAKNPELAKIKRATAA